MATNNFKPFATAANANVTAQADWEALPALLSGFMAGKASSAQVNKAIRQASFIAAALAQYTANKSGLDVLDDGDLNGFISKMGTAFGKDFQALDATLTALAGLATGANKLPYFTGNDTAALTDLTQVGRDIIGKSTIADILTYLRLERFDQDTNETRIWSPDKKSYILVQNGVWGAYSTNSPAGTLPLGLGFGGTGAKDAEGARTSLGLGNSATRNVGTVSGTVAAGDDSRITGAMQKNQNGNDIPDKTAFRSSIGLGSAATRAVGNGANQIPDMSFFSAELAINGWAKLPNGLIIQQGTSTAATPSSPDVLVNLPIPFPTGVLHIGEHDSNGGLSMTLWQLNNITRTAFYASALGGVTRGNTTIRALATSTSCNWFAIGY
ncbi:gp53-like domain-containing protein [Citrobacter freundii]|uniref:gp53-like domain-containing protein n=1 Tax=Citrobacter freundii TaxID=546 RepID=UPI003D6E463E